MPPASRAGTPYQKFAAVYDQMGADQFSIDMVEYCARIFKTFRIRPCPALDLCCGTGSAIERLLEYGFEMSGLDGSSEMLAMAAKKLEGRKVRLYHKALPKFRLIDTDDSRQTESFGLITCFYDSLNYLRNLNELKTAFKSVHQHLEPGGWFIFDMNTPIALETIWDGQVYADATDDLAWVWRNEYFPKARSAMCHTTFFVRDGDMWIRFDEDHFEKAYENKTLRKAVKACGFQVKGFFDCFSFDRATKESDRVCVVARKPLR